MEYIWVQIYFRFEKIPSFCFHYMNRFWQIFIYISPPGQNTTQIYYNLHVVFLVMVKNDTSKVLMNGRAHLNKKINQFGQLNLMIKNPNLWKCEIMLAIGILDITISIHFIQNDGLMLEAELFQFSIYINM